MAKVLWTLLCDRMDSDLVADKFSFIGVFRQVHVIAVPSVYPAMVVVTGIKGEPHEKVRLSLEFYRPNGQSRGRSELEFSLNGTGSAYYHSALHNVTLDAVGSHRFRSTIGDSYADADFLVIQAMPGDTRRQ